MYLNIKLKDGVGPDILTKYGFSPKYDENTGDITQYCREFIIDRNTWSTKHFTFICYTEKHWKLFRRFEYKAWMTGFQWGHVVEPECMKMLYDLIVDGIIEPAELKEIDI